MKKLVIIALAIFGLGIVSCQKQDIQPNAQDRSVVPTWSEDTGARNFNQEPEGGDPSDPVTDPGEEITDPNDKNPNRGKDKNEN